MKAPQPHRASILDISAGFELNSEQEAAKVTSSIKDHLHNDIPKIKIMPSRINGTTCSPDDKQIIQSVLDADLIFMGPGSPTLAVIPLEICNKKSKGATTDGQ